MGLDPSEQTSMSVVASRVNSSPDILAPNHTPKLSGGTKARIKATSTTPKTTHLSTILDSFNPPQNIWSKALGRQSCSFQDAFTDGQNAMSSNSTVLGFPGRTPRSHKRSKIQPLIQAITNDARINSNVHCRPIKPTRISVSVREFHGLAIRNAITCPILAPRSYSFIATIRIPWLHKSSSSPASVARNIPRLLPPLPSTDMIASRGIRPRMPTKKAADSIPHHMAFTIS